MIRTRTTWALTCIAALALAACSGGGDSATAESTGSASAPSEVPSEPAAPTPSPTAGDEPVSAAALCDYLTSLLPDLRAIGSEEGVMATLTLSLFSWYDEQGAVPSGFDIDEQTQAQCPDVGSEVLGLAGISHFTSL
jgi:hypothetical protein